MLLFDAFHYLIFYHLSLFMIFHTQVLAAHKSWKLVLGLQSNPKLRAGLSVLNQK